jgi:extracellular elastinolytic metalloproteinase
MTTHRTLAYLFAATTTLVGCTSDDNDDGVAPQDNRDDAIDRLAQTTGAPVKLEIADDGNASRAITMSAGFALSSSATDKVLAAQEFLATYHDALGLDADAASNFVVARVDQDRAGNIRHVTFQRMFGNIPVFQGALTIHLDPKNGIVRALGDEAYQIGAPTNRIAIEPIDAARATAQHFAIDGFAPSVTSSDGFHTTLAATRTLDPIMVEPRIFKVADDDDRFAYQVAVSWLDANKEQHYELALVDARDGALLGSYNLVNTFTGRVFNVNAQPTANQTADTRTVVSFDGDPASSPQGWVGTARKTIGNNAIAATDLDGNNTVGANETQPTADANNSFDFPYSGTQDASNFKPAAVANAFFLVNDWHDRTYALGFTESAGNFQTNNFGKGGAQNDAVNVDAQDGSGTNNANFATPPDGSAPRMQMFLFTINGGVKEDGDFDPTVIYHENTHGLSNRLVGGGSTGCLNGLQSGGMGEGWSDAYAALFLNNPVIGAYVTGNSTRGIRQFPMDTAPWTYADIKSGTLGEVHDVGELWAATMWELSTHLGAQMTEQLMTSGMKLTPCSPTMLNARDGILQADQNINAGANRCTIFQVFANRQMGVGAASPNHNSTTTITTSNAIPADCQGGGETTVFADDFETDKGWTRNPSGTDTATTGQWERAVPEQTTSSGIKQLSTTPSGTHDLVTGAAAGAKPGDNDLDGGTSSIQSPAIALPATGKITLTFSSYFAHLKNSSALDFFRVQVVGTSTVTVLEIKGSKSDVDAAFSAQSADISQFAGQTIHVLITAADNGSNSLLEAAVDDVKITKQ